MKIQITLSQLQTRHFAESTQFLISDDAVGVNCEKGATTVLKIKAQVPNMWATGCILNNCVCVI